MRTDATTADQLAVDQGKDQQTEDTRSQGPIPADQRAETTPADPTLIRAALDDRRGEAEIGMVIDAAAAGNLPPAALSADPVRSTEGDRRFHTFSADETLAEPARHSDAPESPTHHALLLGAEEDDKPGFPTDDFLVQEPAWRPHVAVPVDMASSADVARHPDAETGTSVSAGSRSFAAAAAGTADVFSIADVHGRPADTMAIKNEAQQIPGSQTPTGNLYVDALIDGGHWGGVGGNPPTLYYYFATTDPYGYLGSDLILGNLSTGDAWNQTDKDAFAAVLQQYESVCGLSFEEAATATDANLLWFKEPDYLMGGALGVHSFPDGLDQWNPWPVLYGAFNDDPEYWTNAQLQPGGDAYDTIIHEIGHGLGLAHPHDGGGLPGSTIFPGATDYGIGQYGLNQSIFTVMSYNPGWTGSPSPSYDYGQPLTPMAFDIAALQALYGANMTTKTGNDTYVLPTVNASGTGWSCIWDAGGTDTIDGSSATSALTINLNEAPLTGANAGGFVSWVNGIAGGFTIAKNAVIENAIGGGSNDTLTGNNVANTLDGGAGADKLAGGGGNDTYILDNLSDVVTEAASAGRDKVTTSVTIANAFANVEDFTLTANVNWTFTGNAVDNVITGNNGINTLSGGTGNDTLVGGGADDTLDGGAGDDDLDGLAGADKLFGGLGNDTYRLDAGDTLTDTGGTSDTIISSLIAGLTAGIENYTYTGAGPWTFTGDANNNALTGNTGADHLSGLGGNDTLDGGANQDTLDGGAGNDTYVVDDAGDTVLEAVNAGIDLVKTKANIDLTAGGFAGQNIENVTLLTGATTVTGNDLANIITGNDAGNTINGGKGNDTINGGAGADTLNGNEDNDTINGGEGINTLNGGAGNDTLTGGSVADTLDGGAGNDSMTGGKGDDVYAVESIGDKVNELLTLAAGGGVDTIKSGITYSLAALANIDNLTLTGSTGQSTDTDAINGTGNALINKMTGNDGDNLLDGGAGIDFYAGGHGNDTFVIDSYAELLNVSDTGGSDTVKSGLWLTTTDILSVFAFVENFTNTGATGWNLHFGVAGAGAGPHKLIGGSGIDTFTGGDQADWLDGGAGADLLAGGKGDDTFIVDNLGDSVNEVGGEGTDLVKTSALITDTTKYANVENFTYTGASAWTFTGNDGNNVITGGIGADKLSGGKGNDTLNGNEGADTLDGGEGNDTMNGGKGDDTYFVDSANDVVSEAGGDGKDTIKSLVDIDLTGNTTIENITLLNNTDPSKSPLNAIGNDFDNIIIGNNGNAVNGGNFLSGGKGNDTITGGDRGDTLDGGAGNDSLTGGKGDDVYVVDSAGDKVNEALTLAAGGGVDTVEAAFTFTLAALTNVDNLTLTGSTGKSTDTNAINGTGNALANVMKGNDGDNLLDGGTGIDTYVGGKGNDTFVIDNLAEFGLLGDTLGNDTIKSALKLTTADLGSSIGMIENFINTGAQAWSIDLSTATGVAHALTGGGANDELTGANLADTIDGGLGADKMTGGDGGDTYIVDNLKDSVVENANQGTDLVKTSALILDATSFANVENFTYTGASAWSFTGNDENNTITGGIGADKLNGGKGNDTLNGNDGNDTLDGGAGNDTMTGGKGDDTYFIDSANDVVDESTGIGIDTVKSLVNVDLNSAAKFKGDIENVTLLQDIANAIFPTTVTGNGLNNVIIGNNAAGGNTLSGGGGNDTITGGDNADTLDGGKDNDTMTGGKGDDTYIVDAAGDKVNETLTLATGGGTDTVKSAITFSLAALANVDNVTLTGTNTGTSADIDAINATGNALVNKLIGNAGDNVLDGGTGIDFFTGGAGDDTFVVDNLAELIGQISDSAGSDTIKTALLLKTADLANVDAFIENYTNTGATAWNLDLSGKNGVAHKLVGGGGVDTFTGADKNDYLDGGAGADLLTGGTGNDTYVVDNIGDKITENGADTGDLVMINRSVDLGLDFGGNIEQATLTGATAINATGNAKNNVLTGNDGANTLNGLAGNDTMSGGKANDIYIVDAAGDKVIESLTAAQGGGIDTVKSDNVDINLNTGNFAGQLIENITLLDNATAANSPLNATGNDLDNIIIGNNGNGVTGDTLSGGKGNDTLTGGNAADTLDGGEGNDTMTGGKGDDIYVVDAAGDKVNETLAVGGGTDTVKSAVNFTLAALANVENLTLTGATAINGTGNALVNTLTGNAGDNILDGSTGIDVFVGGGGNDTFVLDNLGELVAGKITAGSGSDTIKTSLALTQANIADVIGTVENYINTGAIAWNLDMGVTPNVSHKVVGGSGADFFIAGNNGDYLDGGAGADFLQGGAGADTFVIDNAGDQISNNGNAGDTLLINRTINLLTDGTFGNRFENGGLTGAAALNITGTGNANKLSGNDGANVIDGGLGADTMSGGKGADTYLIDDGGDTVIEDLTVAQGGGIDLIKSEVDIDLSVGSFQNQLIENVTLTLTSGAGFVRGNALDNVLVANNLGVVMEGGAGNDTLTGGDGADQLNGGQGNDTMTGGKGDDTYIVDAAGDKVNETLTLAAGGGTDTVKSSVHFSLAALANVDNVILTGTNTGTTADTDAINATGNALVNALTGNAGDNVLDGGTGLDFYVGGAGNDTYVVDNLGELSPGHIIDTSGSDTIKTALLLTTANLNVVGPDIENYTNTGATAWNLDLGTYTGVAHKLIGGGGIDTFIGADKNDTLDGGAGADLLTGGAGNDTYVVDNLGDLITESGGDSGDLVMINRSIDLGANFGGTIEHATLTGATAINATGNGADNTLTGNTANNVLSGLIGEDILVGGKGDDTLTGGADADTFAYHEIADRGTGKDVITDFSKAEGDVLDIADLFTGAGPASVADAFNSGFLKLDHPVNGDTVVSIDVDGGGNNFVTLVTLKAVNIATTDVASFDVT